MPRSLTVNPVGSYNKCPDFCAKKSESSNGNPLQSTAFLNVIKCNRLCNYFIEIEILDAPSTLAPAILHRVCEGELLWKNPNQSRANTWYNSNSSSLRANIWLTVSSSGTSLSSWNKKGRHVIYNYKMLQSYENSCSKSLERKYNHYFKPSRLDPERREKLT